MCCKKTKTYLQVGAGQRIVMVWAAGPAAGTGTPAPLWLKSASPPSDWYYRRTWRESVSNWMCKTGTGATGLEAIFSFSLLERVDLKYEIVTADVFLQTSLQSPQHLQLEHCTWTHQRTRVRKEDVYSPILQVCYFPIIIPRKFPGKTLGHNLVVIIGETETKFSQLFWVQKQMLISRGQAHFNTSQYLFIHYLFINYGKLYPPYMLNGPCRQMSPFCMFSWPDVHWLKNSRLG